VVALVAAVVAVGVGMRLRAKEETAAVPLFVFAGQSNMEGSGLSDELPVALARPRADVRVWDLGDRTWKSAAPTPGGRFGPDVSALARLADELGRPVAGIKVAVGGTTLFRDWDPGRPDGLYVRLQTALSDIALTPLPGGEKAEPAGFFWMQGEADAVNAEGGELYAGELEALVRRLRSDVGRPDLACVFGRIRIDQPGLQVGGVAIREGYAKVASDVGRARVVDTDDLTLRADYLHFDSDATVTLGRRFADAWLALR
jgi:hypothetical protein